ncbi:MAG: FAD-dependent oxidoreductase [Hungatella sp.]|nr:FAD-dependent oxidoreductase [Hungatella sp.]
MINGIEKGPQADVIVVGAGPAGMCAALEAARQGVSVILLEQGGCCGGMATQGLVGPFMTCYDAKGENMIIRGLFEEIVDGLVKREAAIHPSQVRSGTGFTSWIEVGHDHVTPFEPEGLKLVMDEMLTQAEVKILYHTTFFRPVLKGNTIAGVLVNSKKGTEMIEGKVIIDCTGDGDVAYASGVPYELGNEELGIMQPATMFFHIQNVDSKALEEDIKKNRHNFYRKDGVNYRSLHWRVTQAKEKGDWSLNRTSIGIYRMPKEDEWAVNTSRIMKVDATDNESLTRAEIEGRRQVDEIMRFLKLYVPGCQHVRLKSTASHIGIRESRHIQGEYRLTTEDLLEARVPEDSILLASNSIDVHGRFGPASNEYMPIKGDYYGVSYRCLVAKNVEQLLIAGRCVSADSAAAGAIRVIPPCMAMGQAAGAAAALSVKGGMTVRNVDTKVLRDLLKEHGAYL